jgi:hypothetical protein
MKFQLHSKDTAPQDSHTGIAHTMKVDSAIPEISLGIRWQGTGAAHRLSVLEILLQYQGVSPLGKLDMAQERHAE